MRYVSNDLRWARWWLPPLCAALALGMPPGVTQQAQARHEPAAAAVHRGDFTQRELDQMLAPIALYPDSLLSQMLMAATYPLEVVEAAHWARAHPHLQGRHAVDAVDHMPWDPSVKSLVAFPRILAMMNERLQWTRDLGDAFLAQEPHVMDTIQDLRRRALAAGTLRSGSEVRVEQYDRLILIEPVDVDIAYVPYYDPGVVYGRWWWPNDPPVHWAPWPGYVIEPGYAFHWGPAVTVGSVFFFGAFDWHRRHAKVVHRHERTGFVDRTSIVQRVNRGPIVGSRWLHDSNHRHGVDYRSERVRQRIARERIAREENGARVERFMREGRSRSDAGARVEATRVPALQAPSAIPPTQGASDRFDRRRAAESRSALIAPEASREDRVPRIRERAERQQDRATASDPSPESAGRAVPLSDVERSAARGAARAQADRHARALADREARAHAAVEARRAQAVREAQTDRQARAQADRQSRAQPGEEARARAQAEREARAQARARADDEARARAQAPRPVEREARAQVRPQSPPPGRERFETRAQPQRPAHAESRAGRGPEERGNRGNGRSERRERGNS